MVSDLKFLGLSFVLQQVLSSVFRSGDWVVVVCPNTKVARECSHYIASALPRDACFSGRTAVLKNKGRLSVSSADDEIFLPPEQPFTVAFIGWEGDVRGEGMSKWRDRSARVLQT